MGSLMIVLAMPGEKPLSVVAVDDPRLLQLAAVKALEEAESKAAEAARRDPMLGRLHAAEARRLREILALLVPGLALESASVM